MKAIKTILILVATIAIFGIVAVGAYRNGYHAAIEDAELVASSDTGYILSFNGEENWYTFD